MRPSPSQPGNARLLPNKSRLWLKWQIILRPEKPPMLTVVPGIETRCAAPRSSAFFLRSDMPAAYFASYDSGTSAE